MAAKNMAGDTLLPLLSMSAGAKDNMPHRKIHIHLDTPSSVGETRLPGRQFDSFLLIDNGLMSMRTLRSFVTRHFGLCTCHPKSPLCSPAVVTLQLAARNKGQVVIPSTKKSYQ